MHAGGVSIAVVEHHLVSWAADLDQDSQVILTSDLCTQLQRIVICSHRHYRGHIAGIRPPSEAGGGGPLRQALPDGRCQTSTHYYTEWIALTKGIDC